MFLNRQDAGEKLAENMPSFPGKVVVAGLARGGMIVAAEVAKRFSWPLDIVLVRKIGAPDNEELAVGAVAEEGTGVFNEDLIALLGVSQGYLNREVERQKQWIDTWKSQHLGRGHTVKWEGKTVILVDDGIATGASMESAIQSAKARKAGKVVLAVPVASREALQRLSKLVDQVICLSTPSPFNAVGAFYKEFKQTSDAEVVSLLKG